jgi:hypothetical protein
MLVVLLHSAEGCFAPCELELGHILTDHASDALEGTVLIGDHRLVHSTRGIDPGRAEDVRLRGISETDPWSVRYRLVAKWPSLAVLFWSFVPSHGDMHGWQAPKQGRDPFATLSRHLRGPHSTAVPWLFSSMALVAFIMNKI